MIEAVGYIALFGIAIAVMLFGLMMLFAEGMRSSGPENARPGCTVTLVGLVAVGGLVWSLFA